MKYAEDAGIEIAALAFYPNTMDADLEKRQANVDHLMKVIRAASKLGVGMVTTFVGRDQYKTVDENIELMKEVWPPILSLAEELKIKIAIENCPMLFGADQWPGGQNLMTTPEIWRRVFAEFPSDYFGLAFDPSHFVWQMMDYIQPIYEFKDKIFHAHCKDIKLYPEKLKQVGVMAYPLDFMSPKIPGLGDVNWSKFISALTDIGYKEVASLEIEDKAFESCDEDVVKSIILTRDYLSQYII